MDMNIRSTTNNAAAATRNKVDAAAGAVHAAVDKASDATRPAVESIAAGAHDAVNKVASAATQAAEAFDTRGDQLREAQSRLAAVCRTQLREHPFTTIGVAVAAGFALDWILRKR